MYFNGIVRSRQFIFEVGSLQKSQKISFIVITLSIGFLFVCLFCPVLIYSSLKILVTLFFFFFLFSNMYVSIHSAHTRSEYIVRHFVLRNPEQYRSWSSIQLSFFSSFTINSCCASLTIHNHYLLNI